VRAGLKPGPDKQGDDQRPHFFASPAIPGFVMASAEST